MSNTIKLKRGSGSDPGTSDLVVGEVAVRTDNGKLFTKKDDGTIAEISGSGGGSGISDGDKGDITVSNSGATFTIDNGVVSTAKIADDAVDHTKLAAGAANTAAIGNGAVTTAKINDSAVTSAKIADGTIVNADISGSAAIDGSKIQAAGLVNAGVMTAAQHNKLAGIEANATADMTGSEILSTISGENIILGEISSTGNSTFAGNMTISSSDGGSAAAPELDLYRISASPADADYLGQIKFSGESDDDSKEVYAKITGKIGDASSGTEDGIIEIAHRKAGSNNISARFTSETLKLINGTALEVASNITTNGNLTISSAAPQIFLTDTDANDDFAIVVNGGSLRLRDETNSANRFVIDSNGNISAGGTITSTFQGNLTGNVTGNTSGSSGSCTGNAATATTLATARTIAGVSFDGSANISLNNNAITNGAGYLTSVTQGDIANGAVGQNQLASGAVITAKINDDAVTTAKIADTAVTAAKIASNAVYDSAIQSNAVTTAKIQDDAVTYAKIQNVSATNRILGRDSSGAGVIEEITPANLRTMINVEDGATADQTASDILSLLSDQNITTTGLITSKDLILSDGSPSVTFTDSNNNPDFKIVVNGGEFTIEDTTNSADRFVVKSGGNIDIGGNLDVGSGVDVTGNITVSGTVDGRDVASDGSKLDGIEAGATADMSNSEIKTAYEANSNTNAFTDALLSKLNGIAASATNVTNNNQLTNGAGYITSASFSDIAGGGTFTGGIIAPRISANNGIVEMKAEIGTSQTLTTGYNAIAIAPTVASGVTITVPSGAVWAIV